jgi:hypothetical protein
MPDDHSKSVPPLPIPNRTVKRLCADDSAATSVKVGYRQASYREKTRAEMLGFFFVSTFVPTADSFYLRPVLLNRPRVAWLCISETEQLL